MARMGILERLDTIAQGKHLDLIDVVCADAKNEIVLLTTERDALLADKERLDFLDRCNERLNAQYGTTYRWELILNHNVTRLMLDHMAVDLNDAKAHGQPSCRDAIDAAMHKTVHSGG